MSSYATETPENYAPIAPLADQNILENFEAPKGSLFPATQVSPHTDYNEIDNYRELSPSSYSSQNRTRESVEVRESHLKTSVDGSIVRVGKDSVCCELFTLPKARFINIPTSFFNPNKIRVGLSITLRIDEIAGKRKPVVRLRDPIQEKQEEGADFFDRIQF